MTDTYDDYDFEGGPALIVSKRDLATLFGMVPKDIEAYVREGMPVHSKQRRSGSALKLCVPDCVQWLLRHGADPLDDAKRRSLEANARKREVEAAKMESKYVAVETVEEVIRDQVATFQSELQSLPARCPVDVRELVKLEVNAAINRLATGLRHVRR
jgi:phage terminase Nu1 subunit (DNA packaging protein)